MLPDFFHHAGKTGANVSQSIIVDHDFAGNGYLYVKLAGAGHVDLDFEFLQFGVAEMDDILMLVVIMLIRLISHLFVSDCILMLLTLGFLCLLMLVFRLAPGADWQAEPAEQRYKNQDLTGGAGFGPVIDKHDYSLS
jgi:hypothetical protein